MAGDAHDVFLPMIRDWAGRTERATARSCEDLPEDVAFWNEVSATADTCLGTECPRYDDCFVTRMRQRAAESDIVIVNHHLLCADAAVGRTRSARSFRRAAAPILDEAHQLEDVATQYFGFSISNYRVEDLARDVERLAHRATATAPGRSRPGGRQAARSRAHVSSRELRSPHRGDGRVKSEERVRATTESLGQAHGSSRAGRPARSIGRGEPRAAADRPHEARTPRPALAGRARSSTSDAAALARRAGELRDELRFLAVASATTDYVYFVEFRGRGVFLRAAPIDVSAIVRELLFDRMRTTVLTSATLTVDGAFRLHPGAARHPDGRRSSACRPSSTSARRRFSTCRRACPTRVARLRLAAGREVIEILKRTRGRAFVLFTSYATMRAVQAIAEMALDYPDPRRRARRRGRSC